MELNARSIFNQITAPIDQIEIYNSLTSTNEEAKKQMWKRNGIIIAKQQTQGRGQHGHAFFSPAESGIYLSMVFPAFKRFFLNPGMVTLGSGCAVRQAIQQAFARETELKWVNDVYFQGNKTAGILTEGISDSSGAIRNLVVGVGLDLTNTRFGGLQLMNPDVNKYVADLFNAEFEVLNNWSGHRIIADFERHLLWNHQNVSVIVDGELLKGKLDGVDEQGFLKLKQNGDVKLLNPENTQNLREL